LKAIELLLERKLSVKEVALEVGYNSVPTFSNTFFKFLGQRPSDYLNREEILAILYHEMAHFNKYMYMEFT
jgi:AraC-like DNA-binding protein